MSPGKNRSAEPSESRVEATPARAERRRLFIPPAMRATRRAPGPVAVLPLGPVPPSELQLVEDVIGELMGARALRLPSLALPAACFDRGRGQYDADRLLELLFEMLPDSAMRVVGVLDADMFAAGRTFVFGYAHLRDGVAVYSVARLREEWYGRATNEDLQRARSYRALAHELGHTFGNPHCEAATCVMRAVSQVDSLDALPADYCASCLRRVRRGLLTSPTSAEGCFLRAGALLRRRYLARAVEVYREATHKAPLEPRYHNDLGVALLQAADREGARAAFQRAAELCAAFPHPYYNLGILCREEDGGGGADLAERWFAEGLRRDPDPLAAHRYLGRIYEELFNDTLRARRHYSAYVQLGGCEVEGDAAGQRPRVRGPCADGGEPPRLIRSLQTRSGWWTRSRSSAITSASACKSARVSAGADGEWGCDRVPAARCPRPPRRATRPGPFRRCWIGPGGASRSATCAARGSTPRCSSPTRSAAPASGSTRTSTSPSTPMSWPPAAS